MHPYWWLYILLMEDILHQLRYMKPKKPKMWYHPSTGAGFLPSIVVQCNIRRNQANILRTSMWIKIVQPPIIRPILLYYMCIWSCYILFTDCESQGVNLMFATNLEEPTNSFPWRDARPKKEEVQNFWAHFFRDVGCYSWGVLSSDFFCSSSCTEQHTWVMQQ